MSKKPLVILGCGGFAKEAFSWLSQEEYQVEAFYGDRAEPGSSLFGVPMLNSLDGFKGVSFLSAVGAPRDRSNLWTQAVSSGLQPCDPIIHPTAIVGRGSMIGKGSILCPMSIVTADVTIGLGALLNLAVTVGHDCVLGDFITVSPGANISGFVNVGHWSYVGTGAIIREKISIGTEAMVGAGAVVVKNVPRGTTFVGNPARPLKRT